MAASGLNSTIPEFRRTLINSNDSRGAPVRIYAVTIKPLSPFGTPLKGDTIFGQFCWHIAENSQLLPGGLKSWIDCYPERPFAVFSSAWPTFTEKTHTLYAFRKPELPAWMLEDANKDVTCKDRFLERKKNKVRKWLLVEKDLQVQLRSDRILEEHALYQRIFENLPEDEQKWIRRAPKLHQRPVSATEQQHNTINRLTLTTGKEAFAPFVMENLYFLPKLKLVVFVGTDEEACGIDELREALTRMGEWGFGRDASTGLGRFSLLGIEEIPLPNASLTNACLTLSPCVPEPDFFRAMYFRPFTRFGRHGAQLLHTGKPFKNPVVMADEGAVLIPPVGRFPKKPYIGRAVLDISKAQPEAVCQGYSLYLPMRLPAIDEGGDHA